MSGRCLELLFTGAIEIGEIELGLFYQYTSAIATRSSSPAANSVAEPPPGRKPELPAIQGDKKPAWRFDAFLKTSEAKATIGSIIDSVVGHGSSGENEEASDKLPAFVRDIQISPSESSEKGDLISLQISKTNPTPGITETLFFLKVNISAVKFDIVQVARVVSTKSDAKTLIPPKRIIRTSVGQIPFLKMLPVIKELPQPFQLLEYVWVAGTEGLNQGEVENINSHAGSIPILHYKAIESQMTPGSTGNNGNLTPVITSGHHFIVINNDRVVLAHDFTPSKPRAKNPAKLMAEASDAPSVQPETGPSPPTVGALTKQTKFLTINGISLQYKADLLWLFISAKVALGPIELDLIGFGIGISLQEVTLDNLNVEHVLKSIRRDLRGLAVSFNRPPRWRGIGFEPYYFAAVGEYAVVKAQIKDHQDAYKSVLIYAKLDGPLIDLELVVISGVRIGFGVNSIVRSPKVEELYQFPFINDVVLEGASNNPMKLLESMRRLPDAVNPWVQPKQDSFWFVVGLSLSAFDIITATAVAMLEFSDVGIIAKLYADVNAQMPPDVKQKEALILYVEILMTAELNFINDYFSVAGALAPTSFLLVPQCHLAGSFALCFWFGRSPHAGDWVFTLGGYHRKFKRPEHYPDAKRLSIAFCVGKYVSIRGEGYFAITTKCVMGGALIHVQFHAGPIYAYLDTAFDALIQFHPIHYEVDVRVSVGVEFNLEGAFTAHPIRAKIGAELHIEGPQFGGKVHVDFWIHAFDIYFGDRHGIRPPLTLKQFYGILTKAGPPTKPTHADEVSDEYDVQMKFNIEDGGTFRFHISTVFAISQADESEGDQKQASTSTLNDQPIKRAGRLAPIYSTPMKMNKPMNSPIAIEIRDAVSGKLVPGWAAEFVVKPVPSALWANPDDRKQGDLLNSSKGTVNLAMAVRITAPDPVIAVSKIAPFDSSRATRYLVQEKVLDEEFSTQNIFLPAAEAIDQSQAADLKRWDEVEKIWVGGSATDVASQFAKLLGWDRPTQEGDVDAAKPAQKSWDLCTLVPSRLGHEPTS
ncbi:hypothetical protein BCR34DRAFT_603464 [Clohesyomyces aquaticus]|uniref:DUF6603 domain-containing protein n=1 Tax=Clohesyomyces aquaticus TaxID=1231657 RepID=A0A1Y1ZEG2_9PLEO|nr:hypothetical protein BCR34DRAFT_603464 [Clohesyomyces aquaticus]